MIFSIGSKEGQDILVKKLIKNKGFFLDIGCGDPEYTNNTLLLEKNGWTGLLIDLNKFYINDCKTKRTSNSFCFDCRHFSKDNWLNFLLENNCPNIIDYISVDINDANIDFIKNFPFEIYEFKIMTFETDFYQCGDKRKSIAIKILSNFNCYKLLLENAMLLDGRIWEDWWINEKYINCDKFYTKNLCWVNFINNLNSKKLFF